MSEMNIQMVDLSRQYLRLKDELDVAMQTVVASGAYINGPQVKCFSEQLATYLHVPEVIPCGNGTDALQIALMALGLQPGDEVIVPAFTYVAAAEAAALLGLTPVMAEVDLQTFNMDPTKLERIISRQTRAIIVVHLFGQSADMEAILTIAKRYKLFVIEDNAQSLGAEYIFKDGTRKQTGTMGDIGTLSFFPTKPLGCFGDGGAIMARRPELAKLCRMIASHGQEQKYRHKIIGCNSRLDTVQAAVLSVKLRHMDVFTASRRRIAERYDAAFGFLSGVACPVKSSFSTHVYHQYTLRVEDGKRDALQAWLKEKGIPTMVYYPLPIHQQEAYKWCVRIATELNVSEQLCRSVLSLPMHSEMTDEEQTYIIDAVKGGLAAVR
jgi:UDP-2-acetamido-2-deoxy-ribo-hexuluronate aminotransferase